MWPAIFATRVYTFGPVDKVYIGAEVVDGAEVCGCPWVVGTGVTIIEFIFVPGA